MEHRIFRKLCLIAILTLILSTVASLTIYYKFYIDTSERELRNFTILISSNISDEENKIKYLKSIENIDPEIRISYFNKKGEVLFDSKKPIREMTNHSDRPEFIEAEKVGMSNSKRYSKTLSKNTYYFAVKTKENNVLRLSRETESIFGAFFKVLPMDVFISLLIFIFAVIFSKFETKKILSPLNNATTDLDEIDIDKIPEIEPFIRKIKYQNKTITSQLHEIEREKDTISAILNNMCEGIVILDRYKGILVVNSATLNLLNCRDDIVGKYFLNLTINEELIKAISRAYEGEESEGNIYLNGRYIKYIINSIFTREKLTGVILLLIDVTEEQKTLKIREEFSANVSHELKTPLTSIYGFSELLKNNMVTDENDKNEFINRIYEESKRLLTLIDDIMAISNLEREGKVIKTEVDLRSLTEQVFESVSEKAKDRNVSLKLEGNLDLNANSTMMWELIFNLVENGIKYNEDNGYVKVNLSENDDYGIISVSDSGIGISEEDKDRIFERFYRVDKSRSKKSGGTGLGLSIVKHIVLAHNGKIDIESNKGIGTTITAYIKK